MKSFPNLRIALLLAAVLFLGALQGRKAEYLRNAELFYRWTMSSAEQLRIENRIGRDFITEGTEKIEKKDEELFDEIATIAQTVLPDVPLVEGDQNPDGETYSRLVRLVYDGNHDKAIWNLLTSDAMETTRATFLDYHRNEIISSIASQVDMSGVYERGASVNLANIFFGFRKVAANLIWLKVDTFFHQGETHRLMPLMKTCVTLDPNFVEAFSLGAWHIAYNETAHMMDTPEKLKEWRPSYGEYLGEKEIFYYRAVNFLKEGTHKNPREYRLYYDLGYTIYAQKLEDHAEAVKYLTAAIHHRHDRWVPRMLYRSLMLNEEHEKAIAGWTDYLAKHADTLSAPTARKFIVRNQGHLAERESRKLLAAAEVDREEAKAALDEGNTALAAELEKKVEEKTASAEEYNKKAKESWTRMMGEDMDPGFALTKLHILRAQDYAATGRYYEAKALLEVARWETPSMFDEISDIIIDYKQKGGIKLSHSEQKHVIRKREAEEIREMRRLERAEAS